MVWWLERLRLLAASEAWLASFFKSLFCFLALLEFGEGNAFEEVGVEVVGVKVNGLLKSLDCFLVALEFVEGIAFAFVGVGVVGVKADGLLKGAYGFLVALKIIEGIAFALAFFFGV